MTDSIQTFSGDNSVISAMKTLRDTARKIPPFRVLADTQMTWDNAVDAYEGGNENAAVRLGLEALTALRNIFGAFLRNAILGKQVGEKREPGFFANGIAKKEAEFYDDDIIAGLRKKLQEFEILVREETNGMFDRRMEAYMGMREALSAADSTQAKLDSKRMANIVNFLPGEGKELTLTVQKRVAKLQTVRKEAEERRRADEVAKAQRKAVAADARAMFV